jgi:hypothetical protein
LGNRITPPDWTYWIFSLLLIAGLNLLLFENKINSRLTIIWKKWKNAD